MTKHCRDAVQGSTLAEKFTRNRVAQDMGSQRRRCYAASEQCAADNRRDWTTMSKGPEGRAATQKNVIGFDARAAGFKISENGIPDCNGPRSLPSIVSL